MLNLTACQSEVNAQPNAQVEEVSSPEPPVRRTIKMAILLDTSNSMDGLIDQAKAQLWNIVNELSVAKCDGLRPELEIALYQYGNDGLPSREGYIQLVTPLTDDLDQISQSLFGLTTNGGSEFCGQVIQTSLNQLDWEVTNEDYKVIFIAGNEEFIQGTFDYRTACRNAVSKGVIVNTIHCGNFQVGINQEWKNGADLTGGKYMAIDQNSKTEYIASPYDDQITALNSKLNNTYVQYGREGNSKLENMKEQDKNSMSYGAVNSAKRAVTKSSHFYKTKSWDLVEATKDEDFEMAEVEEQYLPEEMKGMTIEQKNQYVAKKSAERVQIKNKIQDLNKKREQYVAQKKAEKAGEDQLGDAILTAVREQAEANRFVFEK
jgi:Tfp pilus assembly protein PilV